MAVYTIKELEKLSGIKAHTIRIWEKRYNLIEPRRTNTNIRYYTDNDLKNWVFAANVIYADGLFKSEFRVWSNGFVEMIDDEVLFGQMPIIEDKKLRQYRARLTPKQEQDTQQ